MQSNSDQKLDAWLKAHTLVDITNRCAFIVGHWFKMPKDIKKSDIMNENISASKIEKKLSIDPKTEIIMLKVKISFVHMIEEKAKGNLPKIFLSLRQYFQEEPCKAIFPDAWEMFSAMEQRKASAHRTCIKNRISKEKFAQHREIQSLTRNMSFRQAGREAGRM